MSLIKHMKCPHTLGGHHRWETIYEEKEWKVQHHKADLIKMTPKPYRLLDPHDHLMASADTEEELKDYLHNLIIH